VARRWAEDDFLARKRSDVSALGIAVLDVVTMLICVVTSETVVKLVASEVGARGFSLGGNDGQAKV
jgi:hypothetical protein